MKGRFYEVEINAVSSNTTTRLFVLTPEILLRVL